MCEHIGYPWTSEMIAVADKHANVYIDTSAYTARRYPRELVDYQREEADDGRARTGLGESLRPALRAGAGTDRARPQTLGGRHGHPVSRPVRRARRL